MKRLVWSGASSHPLPSTAVHLFPAHLCKPGCSWTTGSLCCSAATEAWEREPQRRHPLPHSPSSFSQPWHRCNYGTHVTGANSGAEKSQEINYTIEKRGERERVCWAELSQVGLLQLDLISYPIPSYWGPEHQHRTMLQGRGTHRPTAGANATLKCPLDLPRF